MKASSSLIVSGNVNLTVHSLSSDVSLAPGKDGIMVGFCFVQKKTDKVQEHCLSTVSVNATNFTSKHMEI